MPRPFDYGYPKTFGLPHFGLYQPTLDCILLTVCDIEEALEIQMLASSRYNLFVVDLVSAENYSVNMIDNDCCENWTLSNKEDIDIGLSGSISSIVQVSKLIEISHRDPDASKEKLYLQTIWYHVKYCLQIENHARKQVHDWIDGIFELDFEENDHTITKKYIKQIKTTLYLGTDLDQIENKIKKIKSQIKKHYLHDDFIH